MTAYSPKDVDRC